MTPVRVVWSEDPRDFVGRDWSDLVEADPSGTIFHTPEYLKLYWEEFGGEIDRLLLAFGEAPDGSQVAATAFEAVGGTIRFLGGTEVTDYLGPVGHEDVRDGYADAVWDDLVARGDWARADLGGLPEDSPWLPALGRGAEAAGLSVEQTNDRNGVAPLIELPASWDGYLAQIPSKRRHEIRRKAKKLEAEGGPFSLELATGASLLPLLDRFVELHRLSGGPKGVFMVPGMEIFFRRLGEAFCERGVFRLTFMRLRDQLAAGTIGFSFRGTYSLYNSAFDRTWQRLAPGMVLVAENIRRAIDEGCERFDLLKGDYGYKYRFGARRRAVKRLIVARR